MKHVSLILFVIFFVMSCKSGQKENPVADKGATKLTVNLFEGMTALTEKGIMFGHQDDLAYGIGWIYPDGESDVRKVCSDYPAVIGMDLGYLERGSEYNLDSVSFEAMKRFTLQTYNNGGVVTFSWHAGNPLTGGNTWDISSGKAVASVLPGGINNEEFKQWLDRLALFFSSLKDEEGNAIPIIFRPYHEHTGNWFWWGEKLCSADEFIQLWRFTFDYLCNERKIHNLLFAYSSSGDFRDSSEYLAKYPGDDYVDIMGFDYYYSPDYVGDVSGKLKIITAVAAERKKIAALTETGYESVPDSLWWTTSLWPAVKDSNISYLLVWRNAHNRPGHYYAPFPGQASEVDFIDFYNMPRTLFAGEVAQEKIYR